MASKVFFARLRDGAAPKEQARAAGRLYEAAGVASRISRGDLVAVKLHVGERGNTTHVKPELIREIVGRIKASKAWPFLTETSTLYRGQRENAVRHALLAHGHGFSIERVGAPFLPADGLAGDAGAEVAIAGELHQSVWVAREVLAADALIAVSHATGHMIAGLGACVKNLGMGLASRRGKMRQHEVMDLEVLQARCQGCGRCRRRCPAGAIADEGGVSRILRDECTGCGACMVACRFGAIRYKHGGDPETLQKRMAEHAMGVLAGKESKAFFFNVLVDLTPDCDCLSRSQKKALEDIGVLGSTDPVAVDAATLEMIQMRGGTRLMFPKDRRPDPWVQLVHAEKIGLGTTSHLLVAVD